MYGRMHVCHWYAVSCVCTYMWSTGETIQAPSRSLPAARDTHPRGLQTWCHHASQCRHIHTHITSYVGSSTIGHHTITAVESTDPCRIHYDCSCHITGNNINIILHPTHIPVHPSRTHIRSDGGDTCRGVSCCMMSCIAVVGLCDICVMTVVGDVCMLYVTCCVVYHVHVACVCCMLHVACPTSHVFQYIRVPQPVCEIQSGYEASETRRYRHSQ